ncbi:hypothetical protein IDH70_04620 [Mixta calida]|nr:hypothetical protein IDH70_04620 [Mixta calida]
MGRGRSERRLAEDYHSTHPELSFMTCRYDINV